MKQASAFIAGQKRHAEFILGVEGLDIFDRTETTLGGFYADPPTMTGRAPDGGRIWSLAAVEREISFALARRENPQAHRPRAPWDLPNEIAFPALRRLMVTTAEIANTLPVALARPGTRYLDGVVARLQREVHPPVVALDPGGDLADWQQLDWLDRETGLPVRVTTDPKDIDAVLLETLDQRTIDWATKPPTSAAGLVAVHPNGIRWVGAVSGVIDADLDGVVDLSSRRPVYREADRLTMVQAVAAEMGKRRFADRTGLKPTVAERAARRRPISRRNVLRALEALATESEPRATCGFEGCEEPLSRPNATYCSRVHQIAALHSRKKREAGL